MSPKKILILEAFYGGSHKQLTDFLCDAINNYDENVVLDKVVMLDKKWHWRMRTSSMYFAEQISQSEEPYSTLFVSSVINLAELLGLRTDLVKAHKILYFHENQLIYPVRKQQDRDFQYGYNQIVSCLVADTVLFNSFYNMTSFLNGIKTYMKLMPDYRPKNLMEKISPKCHVLYFPLHLSKNISDRKDVKCDQPLHIVWPHRWEHDKNPDEFFDVLFQLHDKGYQFNISVLGQSYQDIPDIFEEGKSKLAAHILNWGYQQTKEDYIQVLKNADVVISTANHEFFGVSMLEAVSYGCYPLCPNRLVYPEIFSAEYLYNTKQQLLKKLQNFCKRSDLVRKHEIKVELSKFDAEELKHEYLKFILREELCRKDKTIAID